VVSGQGSMSTQTTIVISTDEPFGERKVLPRAEAQFLGQELPRDAGVVHEPDAAEDLVVAQSPLAGVVSSASYHRQQRLDPRP
jgi:hypothetical protein